MAITMQGAWTVSVKSKNAAFAQRFIVTRPGNPDIIVDGVPGNSVFVSVPQWSINVQSRAGSGQPWIDSKQRVSFPSVAGGLLRFDINTDDTGNDKDYNDLVLTCRFVGHGARVGVDPRDRASLARVPQLREVVAWG